MRRLCAVGRGAGNRISLAGGAVLDPEIRRVLDRRTGPSRAAIWRSAARGFIIIALGESIVVTGATFADLAWTTGNRGGAFVSAFIGALAMWWIYFHKGAEAGSEQISRSSEPGRLARLAYTYLHMPIVAGIIVSAVADELVLKHPDGHSDLRTVLQRDRRAACCFWSEPSCSSTSFAAGFSCPMAPASSRSASWPGSPAGCRR